MKITIRIVLAAALTALGGCSTPRTVETASRENTARVSRGVEVRGRGSPVVVFEAGAGDGAEVWKAVVAELAGAAATFTYSRPASWPGAYQLGSRDGAAIVAHVRGVLAQSGQRPPYVLVGHSLGGLYVQLYARTHPEEVAGIVLVDTTTADHHARMRAEQPAAFRMVQALTTLQSASALGAELRGMERTSEAWHAAGPWPSCPAVLLTATRSRPLEGRAFVEFTKRLQAELAADWPGAEQRLVDAEHYIQKERPDVVAAAIREVLARARGAPTTH